MKRLRRIKRLPKRGFRRVIGCQQPESEPTSEFDPTNASVPCLAWYHADDVVDTILWPDRSSNNLDLVGSGDETIDTSTGKRGIYFDSASFGMGNSIGETGPGFLTKFSIYVVCHNKGDEFNGRLLTASSFAGFNIQIRFSVGFGGYAIQTISGAETDDAEIVEVLNETGIVIAKDAGTGGEFSIKRSSSFNETVSTGLVTETLDTLLIGDGSNTIFFEIICFVGILTSSEETQLLSQLASEWQ